MIALEGQHALLQLSVTRMLSCRCAGKHAQLCGAQSGLLCCVVQGPAQHGVPGLVNLFGIESPGLTSSLAIAEMVAQSLDSSTPSAKL